MTRGYGIGAADSHLPADVYTCTLAFKRSSAGDRPATPSSTMETRHLEPGDLQVGVTDVFLEHERAHAAPPNPPLPWLLAWEARRPRWLSEMMAEAL